MLALGLALAIAPAPHPTGARTLPSREAAGASALDAGARFDGTSDDTAAINGLIATLHATGGGTVLLPQGVAHVSGIVLQSFVDVVGTAGTTLVCDAAPCVTQVPGSQLYRSGLSNVHFRAGRSTGTVLSFPSILYSAIDRLIFSGFTEGPLLDFPGAVPTRYDEPAASGNSIFNSFRDLIGYDSATAVPIRIRGHHTGATEDQVFTENQFANLRFQYTRHCIDIVSEADNNDFSGGLCTATTGGTTAIMISDDPTRPDENVHAGANKFANFSFSANADLRAAITYFGGNWTQQNIGYGLSSDAYPPNVTVDAIRHSQGNCWRGGLLTGASDRWFLSDTCTSEHPYGTTAYVDTRTFYAPTAAGFTFGGDALDAIRFLLLANAAPLASGSIQMPCAARDGDLFTLGERTSTVTRLALAACPTQPAGIEGAAAGLGPGDSMTFLFLAAGPAWVRVGGSAASHPGEMTTGTPLPTSAAPTLRACGDNPRVAPGSGNQGGEITPGAGATDCTLVFAAPYPTHAFPTVSLRGPPAGTLSIESYDRGGFTVAFSGTAARAGILYTVQGD